jgi:pyruvate/2-oxoglutarate/acetoin dehydrogenase E1 component
VIFFEQKLLYRKTGFVPEEEYIIPGRRGHKAGGNGRNVVT